MDTHVALGPIYQAAEPFLLAIFNLVVIPVLLAWIGYLLNKWTGIKLTDSANARLQTAAQNAAGRVFARMDPAVANMSIDVHSPLIAAEISNVQSKVGDSLATLGVTPDASAKVIADLTLGKLGVLQATSTATIPSATNL